MRIAGVSFIARWAMLGALLVLASPAVLFAADPGQAPVVGGGPITIPVLSAVTVDPTSVTGGTPVIGHVVLTQAAPGGA